MSTIKVRRLRTGILVSAAAIVLAHVFQWIVPDATTTWNHRIIDRIFQLRADTETFRPPYDDTVVHVDINQSTLQKLGRRHLSREHHARAVANLGAMATAAQLYDVVFVSEREEREDRHLIEATRGAGNVYFGLVFLFESTPFQNGVTADAPSVRRYLEATQWKIVLKDGPDTLPTALDAIITFPKLAAVSRGLGSLNLQYDPDGVYRRYPLLYRYQDAVYPSIVLRTACDYLGVDPGTIILDPGRHLILPAARFPGTENARDIRIPIDASGNMIIDFIGPWERMRHYNFADILGASESTAEMDLWRRELTGKIVVVSEILSGASDAGPVPTDNHYPLSGVHANALHTILTESFLRPTSQLTRIGCELLLAGVATAAFVYLPAMAFGAVVILSAVGFSAIAVGAFLHARWLFDVVSPNGILFVILLAMLVHRAIESTRVSVEAQRERDLVEKELEIGRRIQADFFPSHLPAVPGWELAASIQPAKQVAGDFYDVFPVNGSRSIAVVIGDVCDKGVGAAIFMALFRSLIRALCQQAARADSAKDHGKPWAQALLQGTLQQANDYIAVTHEKACMFATVFFAILDAQTGEMHYVNCGHEPPLFLTTEGHLSHLKPTGPAVGSFPDVAFGCRSIQMEKGDLLFACTDGVYETPDPQDLLFPKDRLHAIINAPHASLDDMLKIIQAAVDRHHQSEAPFDDITMVAVKRKAPDTAGGL